MEAYASYLIEKRTKLRKQKNENSNKEKFEIPKSEKISINKQFNLPIPPSIVSALGKNESAAVWWSHENDLKQQQDIENNKKIVKWLIKRYRKDQDGVWRHKGSMEIDPIEKNQYFYLDLTNNHYYKFTVSAVTTKGTSFESDYSNVVMVEAPLPSGWFRFYDKERQHNYYANLRTKQSSWLRPDLDPYFLNETFLFDFNESEISYLRALYDEEIHHLNVINIEQLVYVLTEVGEQIPTWRLSKLVRSFTSGQESVSTFQQYMTLMQHAKRSKQKSLVSSATQSISRALGMALGGGEAILGFKSKEQKRLGCWVLAFDEFTERPYYRHSATDQQQWEVPEDVRHYLPESEIKKMLKVFDYSQIERITQYFDMLDANQSGSLPYFCIRLLTKELGIAMTDRTFRKFMTSVDQDGNGSIEFDEFCWMLRKLTTGRSGIWELINFKNVLATPTSSFSANSSLGSDQSSLLVVAQVLQRFGGAIVTLAAKREQPQNPEQHEQKPKQEQQEEKFVPIPSSSSKKFREWKKAAPQIHDDKEREDPILSTSVFQQPQTLMDFEAGFGHSALPLETPAFITNDDKDNNKNNTAISYQIPDDSICENPSQLPPPPSFLQTLHHIRLMGGVTQITTMAASLPTMLIRTFSREGSTSSPDSPFRGMLSPMGRSTSYVPPSPIVNFRASRPTPLSKTQLLQSPEPFDLECGVPGDSREERGREFGMVDENLPKSIIETVIKHVSTLQIPVSAFGRNRVHPDDITEGGNQPENHRETNSNIDPCDKDAPRVFQDKDYDDDDVHPQAQSNEINSQELMSIPNLDSKSFNTSTLEASTYTFSSTTLLDNLTIKERLSQIVTIFLQGLLLFLKYAWLIISFAFGSLIWSGKSISVHFFVRYQELRKYLFNIKESMKKPIGPHGEFCFCGCRNLNKRVI